VLESEELKYCAEGSWRKNCFSPPSLNCHAANMTNRNMDGIFPDYCKQPILRGKTPAGVNWPEAALLTHTH